MEITRAAPAITIKPIITPFSTDFIGYHLLRCIWRKACEKRPDMRAIIPQEGDRDAEVPSGAGDSRRGRLDAGTAGGGLQEVARSAGCHGSEDSMGGKLRHRRQGLLRLHCSGRGDHPRTCPARRFPGEPHQRDQKHDRPHHRGTGSPDADRALIRLHDLPGRDRADATTSRYNSSLKGGAMSGFTCPRWSLLAVSLAVPLAVFAQ